MMDNSLQSDGAFDMDLERRLVDFLYDYYSGDPIEIEHCKKWSLNGHTKVIDVAISNNGTLLAVFEIKSSKTPNVVERATRQLISQFSGKATPICYVVVASNGIGKGFEFIDVTKQVIDGNLAFLSQAPRMLKPYDFEKTIGLFNLRIWESAPFEVKQDRSRIVVYVITVIFAIAGIAILILDWQNKYSLSYERLSLMLAIAVITYFGVLFPRVSEVSVGKVAWKLDSARNGSE